MTDKELLELLELTSKVYGALEDKVFDGVFYDPSQPQNRLWNPLEDDGDTLRLEVKLKLTISWEPMRNGWAVGGVVGGEFKWLSFDENRNLATVKAAAEIGKSC